MTHHPEGTMVAETDGAGTNRVRDVIGGRADGVSTDTLAGRTHSLEEHSHSAMKVYPTLADGVTVTAEAADWGVAGALVEIVPAATITNPFDIHYVNIESVSAVDSYELILYYGAGDTDCGRIRFTRTAGLEPILDREVRTPIIPANSRVRARLASSGVGADTVDITLGYHEYI